MSNLHRKGLPSCQPSYYLLVSSKQVLVVKKFDNRLHELIQVTEVNDHTVMKMPGTQDKDYLIVMSVHPSALRVAV